MENIPYWYGYETTQLTGCESTKLGMKRLGSKRPWVGLPTIALFETLLDRTTSCYSQVQTFYWSIFLPFYFILIVWLSRFGTFRLSENLPFKYLSCPCSFIKDFFSFGSTSIKTHSYQDRPSQQESHHQVKQFAVSAVFNWVAKNQSFHNCHSEQRLTSQLINENSK